MSAFYTKVKHLTDPGVILNLNLDVAPDGSHAVLGGTILIQGKGSHSAKWRELKFSGDDFKEIMEKFGFDPVEVGFQAEESIEASRSAEEIL